MPATKPNLTLDAARLRARGMQERLAAGGSAIKLSACFELLALAHGAPNWNVLSARLPRENAPRKQPKALLKALTGHPERGRLLDAYEACSPVVYAGAPAPWGLPIDADEVGLVVPLAVQPHGLGRMLTFVARGGGVRLFHGFAGATEAREGGVREVHDINPRSWYLRQALRQCAATMPGDHTYATLASPVREAMAEALVERAVSAIEAFLAEQAPVRYELMRRSDRWNGNWITHAIASGDPDAYLARFGKHVWMIDQLQLGDARPDDARLRRLYEDPAGAYGRWRLECGLDPVDVLGGPGKGLSWPGMHAEAFADDVCLYDELAARHPGFCAAAGDLLPGRMSWLRVFVEGGHAFSERDLQGLAVALTTIDDAVSLTYANDFRGKPPAEGPCVWDLAEEARLPLARARTTRIRMGRRPEESDRALLDNDRAALLGMAERIGIPEVLSFVAETIQSWDCFYRPAGPPGAIVPPSEHRHLDLAGEVLGHILAEMPGASP